MSLSKEQIEQLFLFTEKKYVKWYDLQVELVDHLANKIEEEMEQNKTLSFDEALKKVYATFGITGFSRIVTEKSEQVNKYNHRLWKEAFLSQFHFPAIIKSIFIFLGLKVAIDYLPFTWFVIALILFAITNMIYSLIENQKNKTKKKHLLLTQYVGIPFFPFIILVQLFSDRIDFHDYAFILAGNKNVFVGIIFIMVLSSLAIKMTQKKINQKAQELYPEAFEIAE